MAITSVTQLRSEFSRDKSDGSRRRSATYQVIGATTPEEAEVADDGSNSIPAFGSSFVDGDGFTMLVSNITSEMSDQSITVWDVTVQWTYTNQQGQDPDRYNNGDEFWTINGRLDGIQVSSAFDQTAVGDLARDVGKLVGAKDDGTVEGAPWDIPVAQLVVTYYKTASTVNSAFVQSVMDELGKVNSGSYYGFAAGEVKFVDFSIPNEGDTITQLTFTFDIKINEPQASLPEYTDPAGSTISFPGDLKGWEYAWTDDVLSDDTDDLAPRTRGLYIAQLYRTTAFSGLPISGSL